MTFKDTIHLFAPEFLFDEFEKYGELIKNKTKRNDKDFDRLMRILREKLRLYQMKKLKRIYQKQKVFALMKMMLSSFFDNTIKFINYI
ncbi:MAG: PIN domain-containing protein [Atribacterota bacterium]